MINQNIINDPIKDSISNCSNSSSILLIGRKKLSMEKDAIKIACSLLEIEHEQQLYSHPDFFLIRLEKGENSYGVDAANRIIERAGYVPTLAHRIVTVIYDFNKMSDDAQNKLLKLIEESKTMILICIAYEDTLLPTIKSRMKTIMYKPETISEYIKNNGASIAEYFTFSNSSDNSDIEHVLPYFEDVFTAFNENDMDSLFKTLHLIDSNDAFFVDCRNYVKNMIQMIGYLAMEKGISSNGYSTYLSVASLCNDELKKYDFIKYTKNQFFLFIVKVVFLLNKSTTQH